MKQGVAPRGKLSGQSGLSQSEIRYFFILVHSENRSCSFSEVLVEARFPPFILETPTKHKPSIIVLFLGLPLLYCFPYADANPQFRVKVLVMSLKLLGKTERLG